MSEGHVKDAPEHVSAGLQAPVEARQTVPELATESAGQATLVPLHTSATSHTPSLARHTAPAGRSPPPSRAQSVSGYSQSAGEQATIPKMHDVTPHGMPSTSQV